MAIDSALDRLIELCSRVTSSSNDLQIQSEAALSACCDSLEAILLRQNAASRQRAQADSTTLGSMSAPPAAPASTPLDVMAPSGRPPDPATSDAMAAQPAPPPPPPPPLDSPFQHSGGARELAEPAQHLLFLVHGIGRNDDFKDDDQMLNWDGTAGTNGSSHEFKKALETVLGSGMRHAPIALSVRTVEWHSRVHEGGSAGADALLHACQPDGVAELRAFTKGHFIDVLHYTSAAHGQRVVLAVVAQLQAKYEAFVRERPGWRGRVSLVGHSLGSVICLDLVTHAGGTFQGIRFPPLPFEVNCLFLLGSPAGLFLVARRQVVQTATRDGQAASTDTDDAQVDGTAAAAAGTAALATASAASSALRASASAPPEAGRLQCERLFNIVSAADPISHFVGPLIAANSRDGGSDRARARAASGSIGGGVQLRAQALAERRPPDELATLPSARALVDGASEPEVARFVHAAAASASVDVLVPTKPSSKL